MGDAPTASGFPREGRREPHGERPTRQRLGQEEGIGVILLQPQQVLNRDTSPEFVRQSLRIANADEGGPLAG